MINNRIRAIVGMGMLAGALGLSALGAASVANAEPTHAPAPQDVCWYTYHPEAGWWYC